MADEEIRPEVYYIPENFDDAGGVLGGHFSTRNAIEMVVLCGPLGIVEYKVFFEFLHVGLQFGLITMMFTIVPLAALAAFGIGGESLSQILMAYIRFIRKRRKLSYVEFTDKMVTYDTAFWSLNGILDSIASEGFKGTFLKMKKYREAIKNGTAVKNEFEDENIDDYQEDDIVETNDIPSIPETETSAEVPPDVPRKSIFAKTPKKKKQLKPVKPKKLKPAKKNQAMDTALQAPIKKAKPPRQKKPKAESVWMKSAMREVLLQKLELGDDEDDDI